MEKIKTNKTIQEQYKDTTHLKTRISFHEKYSVNKQSFGDWIFEQYKIKKNISSNINLSFEQINIQNIPFNNNSFNIIIANMILYHVPDLDKELSEVKHVLKDNGILYNTTYEKHRITEYLQNLLSNYNAQKSINKTFTLQNGEKILRPYFSFIQKCIYEDHLELTNIEDLLNYILYTTF